MSSSNTSLAEINAIRFGSTVFYQFWSYLLICLGTIGHSLNICVFTRPTLRSNPCVRYFLAATISGTLVTYVNVLLRLLQYMYPYYNPFGYSTASCRILTFMVFCTRACTSWFIALASIDRFLCSSPSATIRAWSNLRIASRTILLVIGIVGIFYIYVLIQFENIQTVVKCPGNQGTSALFNSIWGLLIFSLGPSIFMLIFGSLTIRHVQQSVRRIVPQNTRVQNENGSISLPQDQLRRQKTTDRQLIRMMLVQCVYFSLMSTPTSIFWIYNSLRSNIVPDALQSAKDSLFANVAAVLSGTGACTSFYLFTLSSQLFRRELMHLFKRRQRPNQIINSNPIA